MVAGTASGVGKTTVSLVLLAAMRRRGWTVQPFKGGPDFLDTGHLTRIAGRAARNLDTWMLSAEDNQAVLQRASFDADAVLVEGMMGLFDGKNGETETGSSAEIAKLLKLPVVLVLDAAKSARSIAAMVMGFELFDSELAIAGCILNRVAGERHYRMLASAIQSRCKTPLLGWLPREPAIAIPERHLGLHTAEEGSSSAAAMVQTMDTLASLAEQHLDLDQLLSLEVQSQGTLRRDIPAAAGKSDLRIGVARDRASTFYYEDNFDLLRQNGAEIVAFSPLHDTHLPADLDALYLGGGYPELHAAQLAGNISMLDSMRAFAASGRPIYAECGGMMYLARELKTIDGTRHPLAGILPLDIEMTPRLVRFGYVTVTTTSSTVLGAPGTCIRGHSFHHSRITNDVSIQTNYRVNYSLSGEDVLEGYGSGNILGSYIHLHFRATPFVAEYFTAKVRAVKASLMVTA